MKWKKILWVISVDVPKAEQAKPKNPNNKNMFSARDSGWFSIQIKVDFFPLSVKTK